MAMVLLAIAAAGILMPIAAAAAAQVEAQRRVVATRFAADVIETLIAGQPLNETVLPADLGFSGAAYNGLSCLITADNDVGAIGLIYVSVAVKYKQTPIMTLKTLVGKDHLE